MGPIRSGSLIRLGSIRSDVAAADTLHPNGTNPTAPLRMATIGRSRDAWVVVDNDAADAGVSITVTLYGSIDGTGAQATAGSWRAIGQLNSGAAIVPGTNNAITHTNRLNYSESFPGLCGWPYLWATITGTLAQNVDVEVYAEDE